MTAESLDKHTVTKSVIISRLISRCAVILARGFVLAN
jgi:hypothetical protein